MKKALALVVAGLMSVSTASQANPNHWDHRGYHNHYGWVAPLVIGGAVGYALTRPQTVIVQQPPVVYYPNPQPSVPYGYHYENILDANCNCYRVVLVQNQP
jgi:hypothetical protein